MKPLISVGLPVYNGQRFLEEAISSLLAQTHSHIELIISDNASTDRTEDVSKSYASQDSRIRYYRNPTNLGLAPNFNCTFHHSTGEYFKWATADDVCEPTFLERCLDVLAADPTVVLVYPRARFIDENGTILDRTDPGWNLQSEPPHQRLRYVIFAGHLVNSTLGLIRADSLRKTRLLPNYPGGDYALLGELSLLGKFTEIPEFLFRRRLHSGSSSQHGYDMNWMRAYHRPGSGRLCFPFSNLMIDHCRTIVTSKLSAAIKCSLLISLLRRLYWNWRAVVNEIHPGLIRPLQDRRRS